MEDVVEGKSRKRWFWVTIQFTLLLAWFVLLDLGNRIIVDEPLRYIIEVIGMLIACAGLLLASVGVYNLGNNLTPFPDPKQKGSFVTHGIYRHVRHPIYGGIMLVLIGITIALLTPLAGLAVLTVLVFFHVKASYEEMKLRKRFTDYDNYVNRTRRFLPGVW